MRARSFPPDGSERARLTLERRLAGCQSRDVSPQAENFVLQCSRALADGGDLPFEFLQDADGLPAQVGELSEDGAEAEAAHVRQVRARRSGAPQRASAHVLGRDDALTKRHLLLRSFLVLSPK